MAEMNSSATLEATLSGPSDGLNRGQEGICIDQRQLLSVTYIKENMDGETEPRYKVVQQAEVNYLPVPFSMVDLRVGFPVAKVEDLLVQITSPHIEENNGMINAMPIAVKAPNCSFVNNTMRNGKRWASPRPCTTAEERKISVSEKVARLKQNEWLKNWNIEPRQRKNGKWDFFYRHRTLKFMCRSLVEVHCYEMNGVLPKRSKKPKDDGSPLQHQETVKATKKRTFDQGSSSTTTTTPKNNATQTPIRNNTPAPVTDISLIEEEPTAQKMEEFLRESYSNLMNLRFPNHYSNVNDFHYEGEDEILRPNENVEELLRDPFKPVSPPPSTTHKLNSSKGEKERKSKEETSTKRETKKLKATPSPHSQSSQESTTASHNMPSGRVLACANSNPLSGQELASSSTNLLSCQDNESSAKAEDELAHMLLFDVPVHYHLSHFFLP